MPQNRNAMLRYKTIDRCLCNRYRRWTLDDLIDACSEALYEYEGIDKGISRRTIQLDLQTMRSDKLGYNAPIVVVDGKYYTYDDPDYSITHGPLTERDLEGLTDAVEMLKQMVGFPAMAGVADLVSRLDDQLHSARQKQSPLILMESNERLKGLHLIPVIYEALRKKKAIRLTYKSFRVTKASAFVFLPYVLKEFNNRWFLLGRRKDRPKYLYNLAIDRIEEVELLADEYYFKPTDFDAEKYYGEMVGVSRGDDEEPEDVYFWASPDEVPYIITKPLHSSQTIVDERPNGYVLFHLHVIINRELMRLMMGYGAGIRVTSPPKLKKIMGRKLKKAGQAYEMKPSEYLCIEKEERNSRD